MECTFCIFMFILSFSGTVEDLVRTESEKFDAVVASEVVEHVPDLFSFMTSCCNLVKVSVT